MKELTNREMIEKACSVVGPRELFVGEAGSVGCSLLSTSGNLYLGVCIDVGSGIGFCAEHAAIAAMVTAGETGIAKIVAVCSDETVLPPCGRCRELMYEINKGNLGWTEVILSENKTLKLKELLPYPYHQAWNK
jgi:cytidine deaminase